MEHEELEKIIELKTDENEWLDYKQEWHKNNAELLRGILSLVNTCHTKDCYLIFGVVDKTFEVIGVSEDTNRRNTQQITDFMASKSLSNEMPKFKVETFEISGKEIDVLTIFETRHVPLFLTKAYTDRGLQVNAGQIFTRIGDTNTPKNGTANDYVVESLYKKRLRLDTTIYERYKFLIEDTDNWTYLDWEQKLLYNFDPNFYILIVDDEDEESKVHSGDYYSWLANVGLLEWKIDSYKFVRFMYGQHKIFEVGPVLYLSTLCQTLGNLEDIFNRFTK